MIPGTKQIRRWDECPRKGILIKDRVQVSSDRTWGMSWDKRPETGQGTDKKGNRSLRCGSL